MTKRKVLILGGTGMLGHTLYKTYYNDDSFETYATVRNLMSVASFFTAEEQSNIIDGVDGENISRLTDVILTLKPEIVINCIGIIKQLPESNDPIKSLKINSLLPHQIANVCEQSSSRLIHISTDCVFDGKDGNYTEDSHSNASDLYGKSKHLGELLTYRHAVTLRTSIIGPEIKGKLSLVEWFLAQEGQVNGYNGSIFSGVPTIELASIIKKFVIPNTELFGLYHVSAEPITKYNLLETIKKIYQKDIVIHFDGKFREDRSLNSSKFRQITGYVPPSWEELVGKMNLHHNTNK